MSDDWSHLVRAGRIDGLEVRSIGRLAKCSGPPGFMLRDPAGLEIEVVSHWMLTMFANDCSSHTIRAYGLSLLRFFRFLWAVDVGIDRASSVDVRDFVIWARRAPKFVGSRRELGQKRLPVNRLTGKRYQTDKYSASTINHTLTVVHEFYEFCRQQGVGPVLNPVPTKSASDRHRDPEREFDYRSRGAFRQRQPSRSPRALPDDAFEALFQRLGNNRDRALVAFYISSGARASEVLGLTGEMINYGDQLIGVIRKGGLLQWIPVAPDALIWLRLYQLERGTAAAGQPLWLTLKEPRRAVTYDALRVAFTRVNRALGSNWTLHDLRHTFAIRALNAGIRLHELQLLLGHASINTTSVYSMPRAEDVIAHYRAVLSKRPPSDSPAKINYDPDDLDTVLGGSK